MRIQHWGGQIDLGCPLEGSLREEQVCEGAVVSFLGFLLRVFLMFLLHRYIGYMITSFSSTKLLCKRTFHSIDDQRNKIEKMEMVAND